MGRSMREETGGAQQGQNGTWPAGDVDHLPYVLRNGKDELSGIDLSSWHQSTRYKMPRRLVLDRVQSLHSTGGLRGTVDTCCLPGPANRVSCRVNEQAKLQNACRPGIAALRWSSTSMDALSFPPWLWYDRGGRGDADWWKTPRLPLDWGLGTVHSGESRSANRSFGLGAKGRAATTCRRLHRLAEHEGRH